MWVPPREWVAGGVEIARRWGWGWGMGEVEVEERERGGFGVVESSRVLCGATTVGKRTAEMRGLTVEILWARLDVDGKNQHSDKTPRPKPVNFACFASLISSSPLNQITIKYSI
jgi:hypothetical protein